MPFSPGTGGLPATDLKGQIESLKVQQQGIKRQRMHVTKALRNAVKRKNRLQKRARMLSNDDLSTVMLLRHQAAAAASLAGEASGSAAAPDVNDDDEES